MSPRGRATTLFSRSSPNNQRPVPQRRGGRLCAQRRLRTDPRASLRQPRGDEPVRRRPTGAWSDARPWRGPRAQRRQGNPRAQAWTLPLRDGAWCGPAECSSDWAMREEAGIGRMLCMFTIASWNMHKGPASWEHLRSVTQPSPRAYQPPCSGGAPAAGAANWLSDQPAGRGSEQLAHRRSAVPHPRQGWFAQGDMPLVGLRGRVHGNAHAHPPRAGRPS